MKPIQPSLLTALFLTLSLAAPDLRAGIIYDAPFAPFSVTVHDSSTLFNTTVGFNGGRAGLGGPVGLTGTEPGPSYASLSGLVVATFTADPGYVFDSVSLTFGQWSYSNSVEYGGHGYSGSWHIPGATYAGGTNPPEIGAVSSEAWSGSGSSGTFSRSDFTWWSGGGGGGRNLMDGLILMNGMSSFTLTLDLTVFVTNKSSFGTSSFDVHTAMSEAPPVGNPVPDALPVLPVLAAAMAGLVSLRRRLAA